MDTNATHLIDIDTYHRHKYSIYLMDTDTCHRHKSSTYLMDMVTFYFFGYKQKSLILVCKSLSLKTIYCRLLNLSKFIIHSLEPRGVMLLLNLSFTYIADC